MSSCQSFVCFLLPQLWNRQVLAAHEWFAVVVNLHQIPFLGFPLESGLCFYAVTLIRWERVKKVLYFILEPVNKRYGGCLENGASLMVVRSKAMPLTASCLSPLPGFESWLGKKVASDLRLGAGFSRVLQFPSPGTSHALAAIWQKKWRKNEIPNAKCLKIQQQDQQHQKFSILENEHNFLTKWR